MTTAPQAEIAAVPASAPETPVATPSPAAAVVTPAETTPPYFDAKAIDAALGYEGGPSAPAKPETAAVATPAPTEAAAPAATETPVVEAVPAGETTPPATDAPAPTPPADDDAPVSSNDEFDGLSKRVRTAHLPPEVKRVLAFQARMKRDSGQTIEYGAAQGIIDRQEQQAQQAAETAVQEAESTPSPLATLEQEVADIRSKIKEAGDGGSLMTSELADLQIALSDKTADLKLAKFQQEQQQASERAAQQSAEKDRFTASRAQALEQFPNAGRGDTILGAMVSAEITARQNPNHPMHATLFADDAAFTVAKDVAEREADKLVQTLGVSKEHALASLAGKPAAPAQPNPAAPATAATPPAPAAPQPAAGKVSAAPGNASVVTPPAAPSGQDLVKQSLLDPRVADKVLGYDGPALIFG